MPKTNKENQLIETIIPEIIGEDAVKLVKILKTKKNISEFELAKLVKKDVNSVRNLLYRLYDKNLISFTRKKDKKKGWYIYYCTLEAHRLPQVAQELMKQKSEKLRERINREKNNLFYLCPKKCVRLDFDQSANIQFKCPDCGTLLNQEDNSIKIQELETQLHQIEARLNEPEKKTKPTERKTTEKKTQKTKKTVKMKKTKIKKRRK